MGLKEGVRIILFTAIETMDTPAVKEALYKLGRFDPGVVPPVQWSQESHGGPTTFGFAQWKGGKPAVLKGW